MGPYQRTPKKVTRAIKYPGLGVRSAGSVGDFLDTLLGRKFHPLYPKQPFGPPFFRTLTCGWRCTTSTSTSGVTPVHWHDVIPYMCPIVCGIFYRIPSSKLTWQWKFTFSNRKYIFKWWIFHCHVILPEGIT